VLAADFPLNREVGSAFLSSQLLDRVGPSGGVGIRNCLKSLIGLANPIKDFNISVRRGIFFEQGKLISGLWQDTSVWNRNKLLTRIP
jgi:hypothetical protein